MANGEKIVVTIPTDGDIQFEGKNYKGKSCLTDVQDVIKSLGTVTEQSKTCDFHKQPQLKQGQKA